jgi:hypothetical protein
VPTQPTWFEEKSGTGTFCAAAGMLDVAHIRPTRMLLASTASLKVDKSIMLLLDVLS